MDASWFPRHGRPVRPVLPIWMGTLGVGVGSLLLPQGPLRVGATVPVLLYLTSRVRSHTSGNVGEDYITAINISVTLFKWCDFVLFRHAETYMRRVEPDGRRESAQEIENMTVWQKLRWSLSFFCTLRGVGWNWRVKNVEDVPESISRREYVRMQMVKFSLCYLTLDLIGHYVCSSPFGRPGFGLVPDLLAMPFRERALHGWIGAVRAGCDLTFIYYLFSMLAVASGLSRPQDWPPIFGSFSQGYTMRKIWGRCWHQNLRRIFETSGSLVTSALGCAKGSLLSRYTQLYVAFFVSACLHHLGALNVPYLPAAKHQFLFFMLQPIAISLEDAVIHLGRAAGVHPSWKTKMLGFAWVGLFLSCSLPLAAKYTYDVGLGALRHPMIWSISDRLLK